jgi:hypothetical protein
MTLTGVSPSPPLSPLLGEQCLHPRRADARLRPPLCREGVPISQSMPDLSPFQDQP